MKNIILLHGKAGIPKDSWYDDVINFAKEKEIPVFFEEFKRGTSILYSDWEKDFSEKILPFLSSDSIVIAQSVGGGFWQRYYTENDVKIKIHTLIFTSSSVHWSGTESIKDFFTKEFNYKNIKESASFRYLLGGGNDEFISPEDFQFLAKNIEAEYQYYPQMTHMNPSITKHHPYLLGLLNNIL